MEIEQKRFFTLLLPRYRKGLFDHNFKIYVFAEPDMQITSDREGNPVISLIDFEEALEIMFCQRRVYSTQKNILEDPLKLTHSHFTDSKETLTICLTRLVNEENAFDQRYKPHVKFSSSRANPETLAQKIIDSTLSYITYLNSRNEPEREKLKDYLVRAFAQYFFPTHP